MNNNKEERGSHSEKNNKEVSDKTNSYTIEFPLQKGAISQLIRVLRKTRKHSQEQFGELIGVQKSQVSKLESGSNNITLGTMIKIFAALNVKVNIKVKLDKKEDLVVIEKRLKNESESNNE